MKRDVEQKGKQLKNVVYRLPRSSVTFDFIFFFVFTWHTLINAVNIIKSMLMLSEMDNKLKKTWQLTIVIFFDNVT